MGKARLQDVADLAGVSMKTVSNVVRGFEHVSDEMRKRVQHAIDELDYRPDARGRNLATGKSGMLALALADLRIPYFSELAHTVSTLAAERGYRLLLEQTDGTRDGERAIISAAEAGIVDGVLFQPSLLTSTEIARHRRDVPVVLLGETPAPLSVDHVMIDNVAAARGATAHLAALGRRKIGFLGHERTGQTYTSQQRLLGYQEGLEQAGLKLEMSRLIASDAIESQAAAAALTQALHDGVELDGLVCRDDLAAMGALRTLSEHCIHVPTDIAITGWDGVAMTSFTTPSITTIKPDLTGIAVSALDMLQERIEGFDGLGRHKLAEWSLIVRESAPSPAP